MNQFEDRPHPNPLVPYLRRWWPVAAVAVTALLVGRSCTKSGAAPASAYQPAVVTVPTTSPPRIDPLSGLGGPLNPTASALVGADYTSRLELARRITETLQRSPTATTCGLYLGSDPAGVWEVSAQFGPAHPVPLIAACPYPPALPTTSTTKGP